MPYPVRGLVHDPKADCYADTLHHMLLTGHYKSLLIILSQSSMHSMQSAMSITCIIDSPHTSHSLLLYSMPESRLLRPPALLLQVTQSSTWGAANFPKRPLAASSHRHCPSRRQACISMHQHSSCTLCCTFSQKPCMVTLPS